jgi:hypothetical protein
MNDNEHNHNILSHEKYMEMVKKDEEHEAYGAMIHRQLVEERTNTRNYHNDIKMAMDAAIEGLERVRAIYFFDPLPNEVTANEMNDVANIALRKAREFLK